MLVPVVFSNHGMFMFVNSLMKVAASVTNIICITQITFEFRDDHVSTPVDLIKNFKVLKKCRSKLECLIFEMLFIKYSQKATKAYLPE